MTARDGRLDLEQLGLRSGQLKTVAMELRPAEPKLGGVTYAIAGVPVEARIEVSRTTSGFALRLLADVELGGPCMRCLDPAELELSLSAREVEQPDGDELSSPYVDDGVLDAEAWLRDTIVLALPEQVLCRPDCAGICEQCGARLNDFAPGEHTHERPRDPRFAKLRELQRDED